MTRPGPDGAGRARRAAGGGRRRGGGLFESGTWSNRAEAYRAGCAPQVILEACHIAALEFVDLADLKALALDKE